jgi:hypothetical protein
MMEGEENIKGGRKEKRQDSVHTNAVRAGKRTYFFDVRSTRGKDLYLTITESKRHMHGSGDVTYEKHKIFLYKEDFEKFREGFVDALEHIAELQESDEFLSQDEGQHHQVEDAE